MQDQNQVHFSFGGKQFQVNENQLSITGLEAGNAIWQPLIPFLLVFALCMPAIFSESRRITTKFLRLKFRIAISPAFRITLES
jgi:hypothetical protein